MDLTLVFIAGAKAMHQGIAPAVQSFQPVVGGLRHRLGMGTEQGGLTEGMAVSFSNRNDIIQPGCPIQLPPQLGIGSNAGGKGLEGWQRHGTRAAIRGILPAPDLSGSGPPWRVAS